jgi:hypothetical protein
MEQFARGVMMMKSGKKVEVMLNGRGNEGREGPGEEDDGPAAWKVELGVLVSAGLRQIASSCEGFQGPLVVRGEFD